MGRISGLAFTSLAHFTNDGAVFFIPLVAAVLVDAKGFSPLEITAMFFVFYGSSALLSPYVGRLADRTGRPCPLIGAGLALLSLGLVGYALALAYASGAALVAAVALSAVLAGFGSAFYHPLGASVLQGLFPEESKGLALGINGAMGSLGRALYPSLFFLIAVVLTSDGAIAFFALVGFVAAAAIWAAVPRPPPGGTAEEAARAPGAAKAALTKGIVALTGVAFLRSFATTGIASWVPTYLSTQKGLGVSSALGLALTTMYAAAILGQPLFGWLVDRFDKRLVLGLSSTGAALTILAYLDVTSAAAGLALLFLFGLFTFSGFPLLLSLAADYVPRGATGLGNALVWGLGTTTGGVIGPLVVGAIALNDYANLGFAFAVMAGAAVVSAFATALIPRAGRAGKMPLFG